MHEPWKTIADAAAIAGSLAIWLGNVLPALASAVTLAWGIIRIVEWYKAKKGIENAHKQLDRLDS